MIKLLLLALLTPTLSYASIDAIDAKPTAITNDVFSNTYLEGDYNFTVTNTTNEAAEYHYIFKLCASLIDCVEHDSYFRVGAHASRSKIFQLAQNFRYVQSGYYSLTASAEVYNHAHHGLHDSKVYSKTINFYVKD